MRIRDGITQFVINGYTHHSMPIIHTPECHHVKEAFPPYVDEPVLEVFERWPRTGVMTHNGLRKVDLLELLVEASKRPGATVGVCWHCTVEKGEEAAA